MFNGPLANIGSTPKPPRSPRYWLMRVLFLVIIVLAIAVAGYLLISNLTNTAKDDSTAEKVLAIKDLEDADVDLTSDTSNASVENLTKGLKAKIDKQIAAKENPIDTVKELSGVLSNTTNQKRQNQLANFLEEFLANHEDALWLKNKYEMPDQAQVNNWKGELYSYLVYNFQHMMENKYTDADGKLVDKTKEQLKYIDLYLSLANDPKSHIDIPEKDREFITDYEYTHKNIFSTLKADLTARTAR